MKNKCYIAGKIGDLPEKEYKRNFQNGVDEVEALGMEPVNPVNLPHKHDQSWCSFMKEDISAMMQCTNVYALRNWRYSHGATLELNLALQLGLTIIHQK